jgi:hypothetical protein
MTHCKCAFTDADGTFVPGEACAIHPDVKPQREAPSSNERLMLREDGKPYSPDMELSWKTFLGNRGTMSPDFWEVARIAYIAAWHASLTYAKRYDDETSGGIESVAHPTTGERVMIEIDCPDVAIDARWVVGHWCGADWWTGIPGRWIKIEDGWRVLRWRDIPQINAVEPSGPVAVADGFEEMLRVEITSDTPEKVERFRKELCNLILDAPAAGNHDVMVTVHRGDSVPVFETHRSPKELSLAPGTEVVLVGTGTLFAQEGWTIESIDEPRVMKYRVRHSNGSLVDVLAECVRPAKATAPPALKRYALSVGGMVPHAEGPWVRYSENGEDRTP